MSRTRPSAAGMRLPRRPVRWPDSERPPARPDSGPPEAPRGGRRLGHLPRVLLLALAGSGSATAGDAASAPLNLQVLRPAEAGDGLALRATLPPGRPSALVVAPRGTTPAGTPISVESLASAWILPVGTSDASGVLDVTAVLGAGLPELEALAAAVEVRLAVLDPATGACIVSDSIPWFADAEPAVLPEEEARRLAEETAAALEVPETATSAGTDLTAGGPGDQNDGSLAGGDAAVGGSTTDSASTGSAGGAEAATTMGSGGGTITVTLSTTAIHFSGSHDQPTPVQGSGH